MSAAALRSRSIVYWFLGAFSLTLGYVLAARVLGTVTSDAGPQVCGPAVIGRLQQLPTTECGVYLDRFTAFAGIAVVIGLFLVIAGVTARIRARRALAMYGL